MKGEKSCRSFEDRIAAYVLDELAPEGREAVEAHAASCEACAGEIAALRAAVEALRGLPAGGARLDASRREALRARAGEALGRRFPKVRLAAAAAVVLATSAGLAVWLGIQHGRRERRLARAPEAAGIPSRARSAVRGDDAGTGTSSRKAAPHITPQLAAIPKGTDRDGLSNKSFEAHRSTGAETLGAGAGAAGAYGTRFHETSTEIRIEGRYTREFEAPPLVTPPVCDAPPAPRHGTVIVGGSAESRLPPAATPVPPPGPVAARPPGKPAQPASSREKDALARELTGRLAGDAFGLGHLLEGEEVDEEFARDLKEEGYAEDVTGGRFAPGTRGRRRRADRARLSPAERVEAILRSLEPRPGETPDMMFFRFYGDNPFIEVGADPLSTFAVDVDTASYTLTRSYLSRGLIPPKAAVRTEEFVNYFRGGYAPPEEGTFAIYTELAPSPFAHEPGYRLLRIGIKGREVPRETRRPCALVFVIDVSGSMARENRLELVKDALRILVRRLDERDTIGIVVFQSSARKVLDPVGAERAGEILRAIEDLRPGGSTNACAGLVLGFEMATSHFLRGGNNRVILLSDGVANTGVTDREGILARVRAHRRKGIFLNSIGVGMGNHNDALLERLADEGDGQCVYVDRLEEARRVFTRDLMGTLETIAKDVKVQVAFDPEKVVLYRLLGYENRAVADRDFRNDKVDAGEIGAGHEVTALYEILPLEEAEGRLATVTLRYKPVEGSRVRPAVETTAEVARARARPAFEAASPRFRLAAVVAEFAEILRRSFWARRETLDDVLRHAEPLLAPLSGDKDVVEFVALVKQARRLLLQSPPPDELAQAVDALKENAILRARLARLEREEVSRDREEVERLRRQNETLRHRIREILERRLRRGDP